MLGLLAAILVAGSLAGCGSESPVAGDPAAAVSEASGTANATPDGDSARDTSPETVSGSDEQTFVAGSWSEPDAIPGTGGAAGVELGVDAAGNVLAAWLGRRGIAHLAIRSTDTGRWTVPIQLRRVSRHTGLSLAVAPNGAFVLAWLAASGQRAYAVTGSVDAGPRRPAAIGRAHQPPEVAISADGVATVAWSSSDPSKYIPSTSAVVTRRVDARSGLWERAVRFRTAWKGDVAGAVNAAGDAGLLWDSCWYDHGPLYGCDPLEAATREAVETIWTATEVARDVDYYTLSGGESRGLGLAGDGSPTVVWVDALGSVHVGGFGAGGWTESGLSGPETYIDSQFELQGIAVDVDEHGRAIAAWRGGGPDSCDVPEAIEATSRSGSEAIWETPERLATIQADGLCEEPASNPSVVLARDAALVAWREDTGAGSTVRLVPIDPGNAGSAASMSFPGTGRPVLAANESGLVVGAWVSGRVVVVAFNQVEP